MKRILSILAFAALTFSGYSQCNLGMQIFQYGPSCDGTPEHLSVSNGNSELLYNYAWSNGSTDQYIYVSQSGTYFVTVTEIATGCTEVDSIQLTFQTPPSLTLSTTNETCLNCCDGTATAIGSGGSGGYAYDWLYYGYSSTSTISSLCPGGVRVYLIDTVSGCWAVDSAYINPASPAGVGSIVEQNVSVFPNPAKDQLSIQSEEQIQSVAVYSVLGEQVIQTRVGENTFNLDLSRLPAGQYTVEIRFKEDYYRKLIIKE